MATSPIDGFHPSGPQEGASLLARSRSGARELEGSSEYGGYDGSWLPPINQELVSDVDPTLLRWTWPSVDVTQGWYVLVADIPSDYIQETSSPFFVSNATTTCIVAALPSSTLPSSIPASTSIVKVENSATATSSHVPAHSRISLETLGGSVGGVAILIIGVLTAILIIRRRRKRVYTTALLGDVVMSTSILEPYNATSEQFPAERCTASLPLAGRPYPCVMKELRQPLRHGPRIDDTGREVLEQPLPIERAEEPPHETETGQEPMEMISVSVRALQTLLRRVDGAWIDLQRTDGSDDGLSGAAPPEYEEVVRSSRVL